MLLSDEVCLIIGAPSPRGIGLSTARLFASHDARVVILNLRADWATEAAASLYRSGHLGLACDVIDRDACGAAAQALGRIDVLINDAGITQPLKLMETDLEDYDAVRDMNLRRTLYMTQLVVP